LVFDGSHLFALPAKNWGVYSTDVDPESINQSNEEMLKDGTEMERALLGPTKETSLY
jgi:hypothetical protein